MDDDGLSTLNSPLQRSYHATRANFEKIGLAG